MRGAAPQESQTDPKPFSPAELAARKQAALDEVLAAIDLNPRLTREQGDRLARYAGQLATNEAPRVQCWSHDADPEVVQAYLMAEKKIAAASAFSVQALRVADRWTRTATNGTGQGIQGQPVTLTWSIVPDGTPITASDSDDTSDSSSLRARMNAIYGGSSGGAPSAQPWFPVFQAVFDNLALISGLRFVYEPNDDGVAIDGSSSSTDWGALGVRGDIRISGHLIDGNSNTLAYAYYPDNGDVVVDTGDSYILNTTNNSIRLRNIMEHEIGHSLGLGHVCPIDQTKLMEPFINLGFRGSQFDDVYSHQRNYGDPLEVHDSVRNNDTAANATPIALTPGTQAFWQWLSIDDNGDTDFYSFPAVVTQQVTVRIIPSDPNLPNDPVNDTYLEGPQLADGSCSAGTGFDPTTQQDLVLDLIGPNGTSVVTSAPVQAAGVTEQITTFKFTTSGSHYIRVRGGANDRAQLYRMEVLLEGIPPSPELVITSKRFIAESNSGANGVPDPGETIQMGITLANVGNLPANNLTVGVSSLSGVTPLSAAENFGTLAPGDSAERIFTFAVAGTVGQTVNVQLSANATGYSAVVPLPVILGADIGPVPLDERFDASSSIPAGWSMTVTGSGNPWAVSTNRFSSGPNSMFAGSVIFAGESRLDSPAMMVGPGGGVLEFAHQYLLESTRDGGVLEASRNGGAFFDLLNSAATVLAGDYNSTIAATAGSALNGREAWTGSAASFVSTRVKLPAAWAGESIVFRWRLVNNNSTVVTGWNVDDVKFFPLAVADPFRPNVFLTSSGVSLSENTPFGTLSLFLMTPLPLAQSLSVPLEVSGMATPVDLSGSLTLTIPVGQIYVTGEVGAVLDSLVEGTETLVFSIPTASANFAAVEPHVVSLEITDAPVLTATVQLSGLVSNYDGTAKSATVTTTPSGLAVAVTYNGSTTPPTSPGQYAVVATVTTPGYVGSANGTLVINSAFSIWMSSFVSPADPLAAPTADLDADGWDNLGEYTFGTFPNEPTSWPIIQTVITPQVTWMFLQPVPTGITRRVESSTDLKTWSQQGIVEHSFGYEIPNTGSQGFVRVFYELAH